MKCITCVNFSLRDAGKIGKHLFGICAKGEEYQYQSALYERDCKKYHEAKDGDVKMRMEFLKKKGGKHVRSQDQAPDRKA